MSSDESRRPSSANTPGIRLLRLWLWAMPLAMLALAVLFAVLAAGQERWALLAAMAVLALLALALLVIQALILGRLAKEERSHHRRG